MKKIIIFILLCLTLNINSLSIKFKPEILLSLTLKNSAQNNDIMNNGYTRAFDSYFFIIGESELYGRMAIKVKTITNQLMTSKFLKTIIINNENYDKTLKVKNMEDKIKFFIFNSWYKIDLLNSEIEESDLIKTDLTVRKDILMLKNEFGVETILDNFNEDSYLFVPINPMKYDKIEFKIKKMF